MKNKKYIVLAAVLVAAATIASFYLSQKQASACFKDRCFALEVARTPEERASGLMYREHLDADKGMVFIFEKEDVYPFWMKNTKIPLDIIWINESMQAVYITRDAQPCNSSPCPLINPGKKARYVIELNAGTSDDVGLTEGDHASISYLFTFPGI